MNSKKEKRKQSVYICPTYSLIEEDIPLKQFKSRVINSSEWTNKFPTEDGCYWFYGKMNIFQDWKNILVTVDIKGSYMSPIFYEKTCEGLWCRMQLPQLSQE